MSSAAARILPPGKRPRTELGGAVHSDGPGDEPELDTEAGAGRAYSEPALQLVLGGAAAPAAGGSAPTAGGSPPSPDAAADADALGSGAPVARWLRLHPKVQLPDALVAETDPDMVSLAFRVGVDAIAHAKQEAEKGAIDLRATAATHKLEATVVALEARFTAATAAEKRAQEQLTEFQRAHAAKLDEARQQGRADAEARLRRELDDAESRARGWRERYDSQAAECAAAHAAGVAEGMQRSAAHMASMQKHTDNLGEMLRQREVAVHSKLDAVDGTLKGVKDSMSSLSFLRNNSSRKGKAGETSCKQLVAQVYGLVDDFVLTDTSTRAYSGDFELRANGLISMWDVKAHSSTKPSSAAAAAGGAEASANSSGGSSAGDRGDGGRGAGKAGRGGGKAGGAARGSAADTQQPRNVESKELTKFMRDMMTHPHAHFGVLALMEASLANMAYLPVNSVPLPDGRFIFVINRLMHQEDPPTYLQAIMRPIFQLVKHIHDVRAMFMSSRRVNMLSDILTGTPSSSIITAAAPAPPAAGIEVAFRLKNMRLYSICTIQLALSAPNDSRMTLSTCLNALRWTAKSALPSWRACVSVTTRPGISCTFPAGTPSPSERLASSASVFMIFDARVSTNTCLPFRTLSRRTDSAVGAASAAAASASRLPMTGTAISTCSSMASILFFFVIEGCGFERMRLYSGSH